MPYSAAGSHPFDATCGKNSLDTSGLLILDGAVMKNGERGDSRMGMPTKVRCARCGDVKEIQEYKRLDEFADIRRADQARDGSVPFPSRPKRNGAVLKRCLQYGAHAAIAAIFSRAFNMAASLASVPSASPSARTMVTSVNPMK